jgi:hypothetical protein
MKHLIVAIGTLLTLSVAAQIAEVRTYGGIFFDEARAIAEWGDGYALVGTTSSEDNGNSDILLLKLNDDLTVEWTLTLGGTASDQGRDVVLTPDGDVIVLGQTAAGAIGAYDLLVHRIDPEGNIVWQEHYGTTDWDFASSIVFGNNTYFVAGTTYGETPGGSRMVLYRIDGEGNLLDETTYDILPDAEAKDLAFYENAVYMTGTRTFDGGNPQAVIRKLSLSGAVIWEHARDSVAYDGAAVDVGLNGIAAGFSLRDPNENDTWDIQMIGFDYDGNETWSFWANTPDPSNQRTGDIRWVTGPDILVGATTDTYGQGGDGVMVLRCGFDGTFLGVTTIGAGDDEVCHEILEDSQGRIVAVGSTDSYGNGNKDAYLVRLPDRVISDLYDQEVQELTNQSDFVHVDTQHLPLEGPYPNPFNDQLTIPEGCERWSMYSPDGTLVRIGSSSHIHTSEMLSGMYLLVWERNGLVFRERLIKE